MGSKDTVRSHGGGKAHPAGGNGMAAKGRKPMPANYEDWSRDDLYRKAREVGIDGRSKLSKSGLIRALKAH